MKLLNLFLLSKYLFLFVAMVYLFIYLSFLIVYICVVSYLCDNSGELICNARVQNILRYQIQYSLIHSQMILVQQVGGGSGHVPVLR